MTMRVSEEDFPLHFFGDKPIAGMIRELDQSVIKRFFSKHQAAPNLLTGVSTASTKENSPEMLWSDKPRWDDVPGLVCVLVLFTQTVTRFAHSPSPCAFRQGPARPTNYVETLSEEKSRPSSRESAQVLTRAPSIENGG